MLLLSGLFFPVDVKWKVYETRQWGEERRGEDSGERRGVGGSDKSVKIEAQEVPKKERDRERAKMRERDEKTGQTRGLKGMCAYFYSHLSQSV